MAVDKKGRTPLFLRLRREPNRMHEDFQDRAHQHPRLISLADHRGDTPLHAAACNGYLRIVTILLGAAVNVGSKKRERLDCVELARHNNHAECVGILEPHVAHLSTNSNKPRTPQGAAAMRVVYEEKAPVESQMHAVAGAVYLSEEATSGHGTMQMTAQSAACAGYDASPDPGVGQIVGGCEHSRSLR